MSDDFRGPQRKWFNAAALRLGGGDELPRQRALELIAGTPDDALGLIRNVGPKGAAWLRTLAPYRPDLDVANKRCATCRFWSQYCDEAMCGYDGGYCEIARITGARAKELGVQPLMYVVDGGGLHTDPRFGCVQWEAEP